MAQSTSSSDTYTYEPFPVVHSFRTLELLAGQAFDPLRGRLRVHDRESFVSYEALSYVWGDATLTHSICIENKHLPITSNLHAALVRFRFAKEPRFLWADGICINQKDEVEKSKQVRRMDLYYQYAEQVLIYLGEAADGSDTLLPLITLIYTTTVRLTPGFHLSKEIYRFFGLPPAEAAIWTSLRALFLRPWWTRYWVIQEVTNGTKVLLISGEWFCSWDIFSSAIKAAHDHQLPAVATANMEHMEAIHNGLRQLSHMTTLRSSMWRNSKSPTWKLIDLLRRCRSSQASDKRDYIFAMVSLSVEAAEVQTGTHRLPPGTLDPDYTESFHATYIRFARYMADWGEGIKLLYSASHGRTDNTGLPSWVPNWAARDPPYLELAPNDDGAANYYFCAAESAHPFIRLSTIADQLVVRGVVVDTLAEVGAQPDKQLQPGRLDSAGIWNRDFVTVADAGAELFSFLKDIPYPSNDALQEVVWRTLCCNVGSDPGAEAAAELGDAFQALIDIAPILFRRSSSASDDDAADNDKAADIDVEWFGARLGQCNEFLKKAAPFVLHRRRGMGKATGRLAQVPLSTVVGDVLFIPLGSAVPFVLRPVLDGYQLVGECYVYGLMKGEALDMQEFSVEDITLV